ncbi:MAG: phage tail tape measure protein [Candidatus Limnocylindrales bacterium]
MSNPTDITLRLRVQIDNLAGIQSLIGAMQATQRAASATAKSSATAGLAAQRAGARFGLWNDALSRFHRQAWAAQAAMTYMKTAGRSLMGVARDLFGTMKDLTDKWGDFEFALLRAAGAAGVFDRTAPMFDNIKQAIYGATTELKFYTSQDIATSLYKWAAGTGQVIKTQDDLSAAMAATSAVMRVASLNGADVETVINGVISVVKTFHLPFKRAADVAALFNYAAVTTTLEVGDLTQTLKYVAPVASAMGDKIENVVGILAKLGDAGIKGSRAGTALRQFYSNILKMTPRAKKALDGLFKSQGGVNKVLYSAKGKFKGAENYVWQLAKATAGMTQQQKYALLANISTAASLPGLIALVDDASRAQKNGAKSYEQATDIQKKATETTQKQWALLEGSWNGVVATLKSAVEPVLLSVGEILANQFTPVIQDAAKWVKEVVAPWVKAHPDWIAMGAEVAAVAAALTAVSGAALIFSGTIGNVAISSVTAFVKLAGVLIGPLVSLASTVLPAVASAVMALGAPFLIIGAIIAAAVAAYLTNFMGFKDFVDGVVQWLVTNVPGALQTALNAIGSAVSAIVSPITEKLPAIIAFLQGIVDSLATTWVPVFENIAKVAGEVFGNLQTVIGEVVAQVMEHVQPLVDELGKLGSVIYDFIGPAWNFLVTVVGAVLGIIVKAIVEFVNAIAPYVQGFVDLFLRGFGIVAEFVIRTVGNFVSTVIDVIKGFVKVIEGIIEVFTGLLTGNWDKVWHGLGTIVGGFVDAVTGVIRGFAQLVGDIIRTGLQVVTGIFEFVFGQGPGSILKGIGDFVGSATSAIGGFIDSIVKTVTGLPGQMIDAGKNIVKGLWDGISSLGGWLTDKIWSWVKSVIPGPVLDALGIHSPSRVMAGIGKNIVEGLAKGIDATKTAEQSMYRKADSIVTAASRVTSGLTGAQADFSGTFNQTQTFASDRTITIKHEVTSPDGSVGSIELSTLADMISGGELVKALERMATVA